MRGRGGWPAPGAQSISWRRLRVDNAAGVAANGALLFRADFGPAVMLSALPVFWRSVVREKLWYLFDAAAGLFPLGCLILVTGPQPVLENLFVFPVLQSSASRHIRSRCGKAGSHSFLRTSDRVLDQPGGGMASNTD